MGSNYFGAGRLVLVIDDEPDFRLMMEHLLATLGFRVTDAFNGADALAKLEPEMPALILLDLFMPRMDGLEFLRRLRDQGQPPPPIIAVTGDTRLAQHAASAAAQALGAKAVLLKPFSRDQLAQAISFVLEKRETNSTT